MNFRTSAELEQASPSPAVARVIAIRPRSAAETSPLLPGEAIILDLTQARARHEWAELAGRISRGEGPASSALG